jgi:hypothetical protein
LKPGITSATDGRERELHSSTQVSTPSLRVAHASDSRSAATGHARRKGAGFIVYGTVFWLFSVVVLIGTAAPAGQVIVFIVGAPLLIPLMGIFARVS